jgi:signal transduction histidine kinase
MAISQDLELDRVLATVAEESRRILRADFAAVGVLAEDGGALERFVTAGPEGEPLYQGNPPSGRRGLLGAVLEEGRPVRVNDVAGDPRSAGVPPGHHRVDSFLGVPIRIQGRVFGNLYVTNREDGEGFTELDETALSMLAAKVAVAVEKARLFEERGRLIDELETAGRLRARLSSYVNHDIRNALAGILLWTERLERISCQRQDEVGEVALEIRRGSAHALRLLTDVLDLARLEEGRLPTWPRHFSVSGLVKAAVEAAGPGAEDAGVELIRVDVSDGLDVVADPDRVLQVLNNLLGNAVKFSPAGGRVTIEARVVGETRDGAPGPWLALSVSDQGPGIPEADLERIFLGFEQGEGEDLRRRGTGLGLTLSRLLSELMDGALDVSSELGEGSRFTLWLPYRRDAVSREGWIG